MTCTTLGRGIDKKGDQFLK